MNTLFSFRRLMAIITKEAIQMRRDRITFAMMLVVPLMQLLLFGFAINNDPKGLPAALVTTSQDHYTRAMVSAMENTGYYRFDHVVASAEEADRLMAGAADFAGKVEIHEMVMDGDVMKMREIEGGVEIPAGGEVVLKPGGLHVMFMQLDQQLEEGAKLPATLTFEKAGDVTVTFNVESLEQIREHLGGGMEHGSMDQ